MAKSHETKLNGLGDVLAEESRERLEWSEPTDNRDIERLKLERLEWPMTFNGLNGTQRSNGLNDLNGSHFHCRLLPQASYLDGDLGCQKIILCVTRSVIAEC